MIDGDPDVAVDDDHNSDSDDGDYVVSGSDDEEEEDEAEEEEEGDEVVHLPAIPPAAIPPIDPEVRANFVRGLDERQIVVNANVVTSLS